MALLGDQKKLDKDKDGKLTEQDFEMLREQRMSGGLLDDDMMRMGYADGNMVGPEEREVDFGMRDDYVNREILTGIVNESKMIGKYKDKEKYSNPEKLEAHLNKYMDRVEKNTKNQGTLDRAAMMDEFMKELNLYDLGREQMAEGGGPDAPELDRKIYTSPEKIKEYADYYGISEKEVLDRHQQWNLGQWQNIFKKVGFDVDNDYELNRLQDYAEGQTLNTKLKKELFNKYNLPEDSSKEDVLEFVKEVRPDSADKGLFEREQKAEGGEIEMLPDEEMEQNFIDFVVGEALSDEEKSMLEEQLEANPELSVLFDKVVEKASEFTGAGPVDGPGTGTSDDIPARLSDGEFVFTAKAVEQIGADNLMQMMKDAEAAYDAGGEREGYANGDVVKRLDDEQKVMSDDKRVEVTYNINPVGRTNDSLLNKYDAGVMAEDETDRLVKDSMIRGSRYLGS